MNTVFKFYLQAWTLLSLSAAAALVWLFPAVDRLRASYWRAGWQIALAILIFSAALFPITATIDKVRDRMSSKTPFTLDGMTFMATSEYGENGSTLDLSQDYRAIQWMQDHVQGSPVIIEGNVSEYRWGSRYTIYTGLPGVVGWNWHQRQQRAVLESEVVQKRVDSVGLFYESEDRAFVADYLKQYNIRYIIVGGLERAIYSPVGLVKFDLWNGSLWQDVYRDGQTVIYQVKP